MGELCSVDPLIKEGKAGGGGKGEHGSGGRQREGARGERKSLAVDGV